MPGKTLHRRELIRAFGYAGLVAATLIRHRRALAQGHETSIRRLILFYTPGGFFPGGWRSNVPAGGALPIAQTQFGAVIDGARQSILDPLDEAKYQALKQDLLVLDGIDMRAVTNNTGAGVDQHHNGIKAALRGRPISTNDPGPFPGWSLDRIIGSNLFNDKPRPLMLKSPNLNVLLGDFGHQRGIREASEGGTSLEVSNLPALWDSVFQGFTPSGAPTGPTGPSPQLVDRYERQKRFAALTNAEISGLKRRLGKEEQIALDRHLEAMNELTTQIANDYQAASQPSSAPAGAQGQVPAKPASVDGRTALAAMNATAAKVVANAMAFDRIRVATFHLFGHNNSESRWYPGANGAYHEGVCHGGHNGDRLVPAALNASKTLVRMFLDVMLALKEIPEGDGTLLDTTAVATFTDMSNGDHVINVPALFMIGGGGGRTASGARYFNTGRCLKYAPRGHNDYLVSLAHAMGVTEYKDAAGNRKPLTQIGSAQWNQGPLSGLTT